jgi:hypothetical protein
MLGDEVEKISASFELCARIEMGVDHRLVGWIVFDEKSLITHQNCFVDAECFPTGQF